MFTSSQLFSRLALSPLKQKVKVVPPSYIRRHSSTSNASIATGNKPTTLLGRLWAQYTSALLKRPLVVKASTASFIFFVSDSGTQYLMDPTADYELARAGSGAAFGVVATGWLHYWWGFLETFVGKRIPIAQHRFANTIAKVILDQGIGAPFYIFTYYVITNFLQELNNATLTSISNTTTTPSSTSDIIHDEVSPSPSIDAYRIWTETCSRAAEMLPPTMLRHWTLWPAVHTLNFYYSPLHHRVLVQNLVLVGWSGYLSHLNNGGLMTPKEEVEEVIAIKRHETELLQSRRSQDATTSHHTEGK